MSSILEMPLCLNLFLSEDFIFDILHFTLTIMLLILIVFLNVSSQGFILQDKFYIQGILQDKFYIQGLHVFPAIRQNTTFIPRPKASYIRFKWYNKGLIPRPKASYIHFKLYNKGIRLHTYVSSGITRAFGLVL